MKSVAVRRLRILPVPEGTGAAKKQALAFTAGLSGLGFRLRNRNLLDHASPAFYAEHPWLIEILKTMRGGDVEYVPLFLQFPDDVPDDDAYFSRRIVGYVGNLVGTFEEGTRLDNGFIIPKWLFDLREFGADPITQFQSGPFTEQARARLRERAPDSRTEWWDLELVSEPEASERLQQWLIDNLYAKSSIKAALHDDLRTVLQHMGAGGIELKRVVRKENLALLLQMAWQEADGEGLEDLITNPTDLLRLFAALTESNISLAAPIKFPRFSRAQRRKVLSILEACGPNLLEDLGRYRDLWLEIARYIHPGEYAKVYPRMAAAFEALREARVPTFSARTEALLTNGNLEALQDHLRYRPALMGRKLHELLRRFPDQSGSVVEHFASIANAIPVKNLLVMRSYFETINSLEHRTIINKRGQIKVLPNNAKEALSSEQLVSVASTLRSALLDQISKKSSWSGRGVWVDPELARYTVPLQQRAASDGVLSAGRGSRYVLDAHKVLRLFVYWKQAEARTDLDLSVIQFDEDFGYAGHVSYTNLQSEGIKHSGDIQSAPDGAAEFIDISLNAVPKGVRYLAVQIYRYAGERFSDMQCHAGWMLRDTVDNQHQSFDLKTVVHKFDVSGTAAYCVPALIDLKTKEAVITDLYMGKRAFHNNVEGAHGDVALACQEVARFTETRPNLYGLAALHMAARGGRRVPRDKAEITIGWAGCTHNLSDSSLVLSEWL